MTPGMADQLPLFADAPAATPTDAFPEGFRYAPEAIGADEEAALLAWVRGLPFRAFEFHGHTGRRRTVSFGWGYDFAREALHAAPPLPDALHAVRAAAARVADLAPDALVQALVTEYEAGAGIGWHRDKRVFGDVVGVSLGAPCRFRLRRARGDRWERVTLDAAPRSVYLLRGPSRTEWEHSIPPVDALRYSITFRSLAPDAAR